MNNPTPAEIAALERRIAEGVMGWEQSYPGSPRPLSDSWKDSNGDTRYIGVPLDKDRHLYWSPWNDPAAALEVLVRLAKIDPPEFPNDNVCFTITKLRDEYRVLTQKHFAYATGDHYGPAVCRLAEKILNAEKT